MITAKTRCLRDEAAQLDVSERCRPNDKNLMNFLKKKKKERTKTDFGESFEGLLKKIRARGKERGKINWQKGLQTLPETETSAQAGSIQTLTQPGHKLKL